MNEMRRRVLRACIAAAEKATCFEDMEAVMSDLQSVMDEEEETRDNMPENLLSSDRYCDSEAASDLMEQAMECYEEASELFEEEDPTKITVLVKEANDFLRGIPKVN